MDIGEGFRRAGKAPSKLVDFSSSVRHQRFTMRIAKAKRPFDMEVHFRKPLFAHLATYCDEGPRESPVWFIWEENAIWIIGHETTDSFPKRIRNDPRVAVGIVDFDVQRGLVHHLGIRGKGVV